MADEREALLINNKTLKRCLSNDGDELQSLRSCLRWVCIDQSNPWRLCFSWAVFILLAIIVPLISHFLLVCTNCNQNHRRPYDSVLQLSLSAVAILSFFSLSRFFRKYGLRRFLFLDKLFDESEKVRRGYTEQLNRSWKLLSLFVFPCFAAEIAYKIWWYSSGASGIPFLGNIYASDAIACILQLCSWLYRTSIFFLVCVLFRLICHLQILRLHDFAQVFQEESDVGTVLKEHLRIRRHLKIISHRFRAFILFALGFVTASQFASLLITTRSSAVVNIFTAGELAVCSVSLVTGMFISLRSAAKITHKALSIRCLAAKWHVCATIDSFDGSDGETPINQITPTSQICPINIGDEESDGEEVMDDDDELENIKIMPIYARTISFQKRQALVTYLENNHAGITVFGFMMDRTYLHTIFGIELSLVLWLLSKTVGIS